MVYNYSYLKLVCLVSEIESVGLVTMAFIEYSLNSWSNVLL